MRCASVRLNTRDNRRAIRLSGCSSGGGGGGGNVGGGGNALISCSLMTAATSDESARGDQSAPAQCWSLLRSSTSAHTHADPTSGADEQRQRATSARARAKKPPQLLVGEINSGAFSCHNRPISAAADSSSHIKKRPTFCLFTNSKNFRLPTAMSKKNEKRGKLSVDVGQVRKTNGDDNNEADFFSIAKRRHKCNEQ